jgi:hypothetical protein
LLRLWGSASTTLIARAWAPQASALSAFATRTVELAGEPAVAAFLALATRNMETTKAAVEQRNRELVRSQCDEKRHAVEAALAAQVSDCRAPRCP